MAAEGEAFPELVRGGIQYNQEVNIFQWGHCDTLVWFFYCLAAANNKRFGFSRARWYDIGTGIVFELSDRREVGGSFAVEGEATGEVCQGDVCWGLEMPCDEKQQHKLERGISRIVATVKTRMRVIVRTLPVLLLP